MTNHSLDVSLPPTPAVFVLCDLDGTLVLDNSFHVFLAVIWARATLRQRISFGAAVLPRAFGSFAGGHAGLKRRVLARFERESITWREGVISATLGRLEHTLSEPVVRVLNCWRRRGARIVVATAAPDLYARQLARSFGADCLATESGVGAGWHELLGEHKAQACQTLIDSIPGARVVVLTDHPDDLPLLALADEAVVQAMPDRFARIVAGLAPGVPVTHVDPTAAQEGGGYWLWLDDRPHGPLDLWEVRTILSKHRHALLYTGQGHWSRIGPGQPLTAAALRLDCPLPPSSLRRLTTLFRRRVVRDWLGIFH